MRSFEHVNAQTVKEATTLLEKYKGKAILNAGGTEVLSIFKGEYLSDFPEAVINIKTLSGLNYIKEEKGVFKIGALTQLSEIAKSPLLKKYCETFVEATHSVATPQIRNMATIGGNLCQDVRCWYYRYPFKIGGPIVCLRKGGKICNALTGDHRYHSIFGAAGLSVYPCASNCPANIPIPAYLNVVKNGHFLEAAKALIDFNPIPAITGRVCPIFCEPECNRSEFDEPVAIRCVERSLGDEILRRMAEIFTPPEKESSKKIAIIGSGPAGLSAAYYLRRSGYQVTVFERMEEPGGMLLYSIPPYRLPQGVVRKQIEALKGMGIQFEVGVDVGRDISVTKLMSRFDAVFLATGAWKEKPLGIKGERVALSGLEFLNKVNQGLREIPGRRIAVIGGGNVAMDVARALRRLGAEPVVIYRRSQDEMPAFRDEVKKAKEEEIKFEFLTTPTEASGVHGKILLKCVRMKLGSRDASGRPKPIRIPGSDFTAPFDAVIKAIGEEPDRSILPAKFQRKVFKGTSSAYPLGENLFVGGDFMTGPSTVAQAMASGREAAQLIVQSLKVGKSSVKGSELKSEFISPSFKAIPRVQIPELPVSERIKSIDIEDTPSLGLSEIETEASRCFNCGCLAVGPSDIAVSLIALDAKIITTKRTLDAQHFFTASATRTTILAPDELVTEIQIPKPLNGVRQAYLKFTLRNPVDFAVVSVASAITVERGRCKNARIVLGAVAPAPFRATKTEELIKGKPINPNTAAEAAQLSVADAMPLSMSAYKVEIVKTLIKRALLESVHPITIRSS